jgi:dolichol kinase
VTATLTHSHTVALELHALLRDLDPARLGRTGSKQERLDAIRGQLAELLDGNLTSDDAIDALSEQLQQLYDALESWSPGTRAEWEAFRRDLAPAYESLAAELGQLDLHVPQLRPTNWTRSFFHIAGAAIGVAMIELLPVHWLLPIAAVMAVSGWSMELTRRYSPAWNNVLMKVFARVAHPHEAHRVNSSTWYVSALLLLALTGEPIVCAVAVAILGISDPAAATVGRRFGTIKLVNGRSLQGSLAFLFTGVGVAYMLLSLFHPELMGWRGLVVSLCAALPATIAELFARRIDDNFAIPVTAAGGAWIALALLAQ